MSDENLQFIALAERIAPIIKLAVQASYRAQGHELTSKLINSIDYAIQEIVTGAAIEYSMLEYGVPVNSGVSAANIPYTKFSGNKFSKYIAGLILFARLRFKVPLIEAKRIAFAIAAKHKKEGMPTQASRIYSQTGQRTGAIQAGIDDSQEKVNELIQEAVNIYITSLMIEAWSEIAT